jgi:hypothetical protein
MAFFDKKQEVIDIQLTQYGKNLLARGAFKPVYYSFFDDDIIYNAAPTGITEKQNRSQDRIKEAQRPRTQYSVTSVEETYDQLAELIESGQRERFQEIKRTQDTEISEKILSHPLQNTVLSSQNAPRLKVNALQCRITSSANTITSKEIVKNIPQLNFSASYSLTRDDSREKEIDIESIPVDSEYYIDLTSDEIQFLNDTKIRVEREDVILDVTEEYSARTINEFEIEFYEILEEGTTQHLLRLKEEDEVYKYFDILVDDQIDKNIKESAENRRHVTARTKS